MAGKALNIGGKLMDLSIPRVMGIMNVTDDSFYAKSRFASKDNILFRARQIMEEGGSFVDIGGCSTRPGAELVPEEVETERVAFAVECVRGEFPELPVSVDTFRAKVAEVAVRECGASVVNDVSGGELDDKMISTVARLGVPYVLMHCGKNPDNMHKLNSYDDFLRDIFLYFSEKLQNLHLQGVKDVLIDPGFGFGKTMEQNYELLGSLPLFESLDCPVLAGVSRKRMVWQLLGSSPDEALNGTTALNVLALVNGADILRVHDVRAAAEAVKIVEMYRKCK